MIGYIYCITDTTNGKQYIGQHHYDKDELDPNYHGSGIIISKIWNNRPHTLKEEYLKTCYSQKELDEWEKYFIFTNDTLHPNGYNLTEGGGGGIPCEETRKKLSDAGKGRDFSKRNQNGHKNPFYGKHHTEESKRKIGYKNSGKNSSWYGKHHTEEQRRKISKPVLQYTISGDFVNEWLSTRECDKYGFDHKCISMCCRGKLKQHKGYIWKYKD